MKKNWSGAAVNMLLLARGSYTKDTLTVSQLCFSTGKVVNQTNTQMQRPPIASAWCHPKNVTQSPDRSTIKELNASISVCSQTALRFTSSPWGFELDAHSGKSQSAPA
mmetsp:Transcript_37524/g.58611  ORF Transcript_37524/g.58611 Transcript_37524/m.58611 type:complete len:108 (+) Transcript_37524:38-361(+)